MEEKKIDKFTMLIEMLDEMKHSIDNMVEVTEQQKLLLDVVSKSKQKDKFKEFIEESNSQLEKMYAQTNTLKNRYNLLSELLNKCEKNEDNKSIVILTLDALGVFDYNYD